MIINVDMNFHLRSCMNSCCSYVQQMIHGWQCQLPCLNGMCGESQIAIDIVGCAIALSYESSAAYRYSHKLMVHSIWESNCKIPMDCSKFHVTHDIALLLCTGRKWMPVNRYIMYSHRLNYCTCHPQWVGNWINAALPMLFISDYVRCCCWQNSGISYRFRLEVYVSQNPSSNVVVFLFQAYI